MTFSDEIVVANGMVGMDQRGPHDLDPSLFDWEQAPTRTTSGMPRNAELADPSAEPPDVTGVAVKFLVYPEEGDDRPLIEIVRFPPHSKTAPHWHSEGEFVYVLKGMAQFGGKDLLPGEMAYMDARTVYGPECAGPDGAEVLVIRRGHAKTTFV
jgi:quercetin dioxygenase-like cupin family protein